ncbi:hypothetical protein Tco_1151332 [Tanacetum coccineum]
MAAEVPQTLEYRGGQLNPAHVLEVENFINWKKRFLCHIIGIEPQFENIIKNGPYIPMTADHEKLESQWTSDERKAANLDQRLKSLIVYVLPDDQMNSVIRKYKALMNELVNDGITLSKLKINTGFINGLPKKWLSFCQSLRNTNHVKDSRRILKGSTGPRQLTKLNVTSVAGWLRPSKDFEAKYNKVKAKLALLSSSASPSKSTMIKNKGLIAEAYEWDEEEVSLDDNEMVKVKVLMALAEEIVVTDSSSTDYDLANESLVNCTPLPPLEKLSGVEPVSGPKTIKPILKPKSKFKAEALKGTILNDPSSALAKNNKKNFSFYNQLSPCWKVPSDILQNKYKTQFKKGCELCGLNNHLSENYYKVLFCKKYERTDHKSCDHAEYMSRMNIRGIISRIPQHVPKRCETCGSNAHTTSDHNDIEWFRNGDVSQSRSVMSLNSKWTISNATKSRTPTKSGCSRHMTGVKSYLHKYVEQPRPKVVFGDDSTCITEGYGSVTCNGIVLTKVAFVNGLKYNLVSISQLCDAKYIVQFNEKRRTILNSNKEIVIIDPRVRDVYVLDMTSAEQESCFFARASKNLN